MNAAHGALEEQLAAENPWSESKLIPAASQPQIAPAVFKDQTRTYEVRCHQHLDTAPPHPTLTTFSATYVNGSTVKCEKKSSTIANIRNEELKDGTIQTLAWKV